METQKSTLGLGVAIIVGLLLASAAFFGGKQYQSNHDKSLPVASPALVSHSYSLLPVAKGSDIGTGQITKIDDKSLTLKLKSGHSYSFNLLPATQVVRRIGYLKSDLKVGDQVTVVAQKNNKGGFTAQYIQLLSSVPASKE